jgi:hypothetical protein
VPDCAVHVRLAETVETLQRDGVVSVEGLLPRQVEDILKHLRASPRYACHVERDRQPYTGGDVSCWAMETLVAAPYFFEWALSFQEIAAAYLGTFPRLYSVNAFETYPSLSRLNPDIQEFHHDKDDTRFVAVFLYLTDVLTPEDGPHEYQRGTHLGLGNRGLAAIYGPRGTAFLSDGRGQHRGLRPTQRPRAIAWARWGVSNPPAAYVWDRMAPVSRAVLGDRYPVDASVQESIRLVVA